MGRLRTNPIRTIAYTSLTLLAVSSMVLAQDAPRGWRRVGDPPPPNQISDPGNPGVAAPNWQDQEGGGPQRSQTPPPNYQPESGSPSPITIRQGTYITVRI